MMNVFTRVRPHQNPVFEQSSINTHTHTHTQVSRGKRQPVLLHIQRMRKNATRIRSGATCGRSGCAVLRPLKQQELLKAR